VKVVRDWIGNSVSRQFTAASLFIVLLTVGALSVLSINYTLGLSRQLIEQQLDSAVNLGARHIELMLDNAVTEVESLAGNPLVANSLVDSSGREEYLRPFLRGYPYHSHGDLQPLLTLYDFKGRPLANSRDAPVQDVGSEPWFSEAIDKGTSFGFIDNSKLVLSFPVIYTATGLPEGVLVASFPLASVFTAARQPVVQEVSLLLLDGGGRELATYGEPLASYKAANKTLELPELLKGLNLQVQARKDLDVAKAPLRQLWLIIAIIGALLTVATIVLTNLLGLRITRRLTRLADTAEKVGRIQVEVASPDMILRASALDTRGDDEIARLARSFAHMIGRIWEAQTVLEQRVEERTAEVKTAELELRNQASRLNAIVDNVLDSIITTDASGKILSTNRATERIFGWQTAEMIGHNISMLMSSRDRERHDGYIRRYLETGDQQVIGAGRQVQGKRKGGELFPLDLAVSEVHHFGQILFVGVLRDITERVQAQELLTRAKTEAEAAARAKAEFLAVMSHEIRTPLNGVLGTVSLMLDGELEAGQRRLAEIAQSSGRALLNIVNDILDFSKIEAGKLTLADETFCPEDLAHDAASIVKPYADEKGLKLDVQVDPTLPGWLRGDHLRIQQVLLNLLSNAVKFTEVGEVALIIKPGTKANRILFAVKDSGIGISAANQARLFQKFSQIDQASTRKAGGTGLGLAICKALVELMRGQITLESEPGIGSTFKVELPLVEAAAPLTTAQITPTCTLKGRRVLVAEDIEVNRLVATTMLERMGIVCTTVQDGKQAVEAVRDGDFDLVLMDIAMPEMNGLEATRAIRALPGGKGALPVIAMTALSLPGDEDQCAAAGMNDFISKPIDRVTLAATLESWLADRPSGRSTHFNERTIAALTADTGPETAIKIAAKVAEELPRRASQITIALEADNLSAVGQEAHAIKGLALTFGIDELARQAQEVEAACRIKEASRSRDAARVLLSSIDDALGALRARFALTSEKA
jgi:PAS domain S-box-containing protein